MAQSTLVAAPAPLKLQDSFRWDPYNKETATAPGTPCSLAASTSTYVGYPCSSTTSTEWDRSSNSSDGLSGPATPNAEMVVSHSHAHSAHQVPSYPASNVHSPRPNGDRLVEYLRTLNTDSLILNTVEGLSHNDQELVLTTVASSSSAFMDLCLRDRGNVAVQILTVFSGTEFVDHRCDTIYGFVLKHFDELVYHQQGAIAVTRLYEIAPTITRHQMHELTIARFEHMAVHPFANFLITLVMKTITNGATAHSQASREVLKRLAAPLSNLNVILVMATSKSGSHVLDAWVAAAEESDFLSVAGNLINAHNVVAELSISPVGNYPLQKIFQRLATSKAAKSYTAQLRQLQGVIAGSKYAINLKKALAGRLVARKTPKENNHK